ncbi:hypothetical protein LKF67_2470 [Lactococcus lactis subsp. lactis]|nr:hypothetical protein LKF67_2470 [Lactococcus lactis subsp. lactis]
MEVGSIGIIPSTLSPMVLTLPYNYGERCVDTQVHVQFD